MNWGGGFADGTDDQISAMYGSNHLQDKIQRMRKIPGYILVNEEYTEYMRSIIDAYIMGYTYPFITSCCCLLERVLNVMILKLKKYFIDTTQYKKIEKYIKDRKNRHENANDGIIDWNLMITSLLKWGIINKNQKKIFDSFKKYRNESVHYNSDYPFHGLMDKLILDLIGLMKSLFDLFERTDILYPVPGEFWIRSEKMEDPFVKEFFISNSSMSAYGGNIFEEFYSEEGVEPGYLNQPDFFNKKQEYLNKFFEEMKENNNKTKIPTFEKIELYGYQVFVRII